MRLLLYATSHALKALDAIKVDMHVKALPADYICTWFWNDHARPVVGRQQHDTEDYDGLVPLTPTRVLVQTRHNIHKRRPQILLLDSAQLAVECILTPSVVCIPMPWDLQWQPHAGAASQPRVHACHATLAQAV